MIAALYVDLERGPYVPLLGAEACWGIERDARLYEGPGPVIAHPPCGPWGLLRWSWARAKGRSPEEAEAERSCGPRAVEQVRRYGGVLEHPAHSTLWAACGMARPGCLPDAWGGWTVEVEQCRWGHPAQKSTWIYVVGPWRLPPVPEWKEPTHVIDTPRAAKSGDYSKGRHLPKSQRHLTPPAFAAWLVEIAQGCSIR